MLFAVAFDERTALRQRRRPVDGPRVIAIREFAKLFELQSATATAARIRAAKPCIDLSANTQRKQPCRFQKFR